MFSHRVTSGHEPAWNLEDGIRTVAVPGGRALNHVALLAAHCGDLAASIPVPDLGGAVVI